MARVEAARVLFLVLATIIGTTCAIGLPPIPNKNLLSSAGDLMKCASVSKFEDGTCDAENNIEDCGYDGGDCCTCSEVSGGSESCIDPSSPCYNADVASPGFAMSSSSSCWEWAMADGWCDSYNNKADCDYDEGDCCSCDCVDESYDCGVHGYACIDPESSCVDDDDKTMYEVRCSSVSAMGDGSCDQSNNEAECAYDGGDCCSCTCDDTNSSYTCGEYGYQCIDPEASCVDDDDITSEMVSTCWVSDIGDGYCSSQNNVGVCDYDGGDCCSCDCGNNGSYSCAYSSFQCVDPASACVDDDDWTVSQVGVCTFKRGDGECDQDNNNAECDYDGGDCCECTCDDTDSDYECGVTSRYLCIDPAAACVDDDDVELSYVSNCDIDSIGDGYCDRWTNNEEACGYDGGDCCQCDCVDGAIYDCGDYSYACIDPSSSCVNDDDYESTGTDECVGEIFGCLADSSCVSCLEDIDGDASITCTATIDPDTCAGVADIYCCLLTGGGACTSNDALVDYITCYHNMETGDECIFGDDFCEYTEPSGAKSSFASSPMVATVGAAAAYLVATAVMAVLFEN